MDQLNVNQDYVIAQHTHTQRQYINQIFFFLFKYVASKLYKSDCLFSLNPYQIIPHCLCCCFFCFEPENPALNSLRSKVMNTNSVLWYGLSRFHICLLILLIEQRLMTSPVYTILNVAKRLNPLGTIMEEMWNYVRFALFIAPFRNIFNHRRSA